MFTQVSVCPRMGGVSQHAIEHEGMSAQVRVCLEGVCLRGMSTRVCLSMVSTTLPGQTPPMKRTVDILLECILVYFTSSHEFEFQDTAVVPF